MKKIKPIKLTTEAFKPYGWAIMQGEQEPDLVKDQIDYWDTVADISNLGDMGTLGFMRSKKIPVELDLLNLMYDSIRMYITLDGNSSVIFVALNGDDGKPDFDTMKAFLMEDGQGVVIDKNVWHCTPYTLDEKTDFAMGLKNNVLFKEADGTLNVNMDTIVYYELEEKYTID